jgi:Tfp pilus assembly protein PilF/uncharacterized protein (AIM24 family)
MPDAKEKVPKHEERTTERRLVAAAAVMNNNTPARDVASEDFLFHLYRGSELLQDNRVHEAKEELEQALTLQPRDPKGQDLLAVVYFRIGLYPRAIHIYEQLKRENPRDASVKLNLALCYLKTGQAQAARFELEDVVRTHPAHKRAWGYLGLAHERLGDLDKAINAFERGGHTAMARRVAEVQGAGARLTPVTGGADVEVRTTVATAFEELDAGEISFSLAASSTPERAESETWKSVELGEARRPAVVLPVSSEGWTVPPSARAVASLQAEALQASHVPREAMSSAAPASSRSPASLAELARSSLLIFPRASGASLHPSGLALVRTTGAVDGSVGHAFAARLESIRSQSGTVHTEIMQRQTRGKVSSESFGGLGSPMVKVSGAGELVLGPRPSHTLLAFTLHDDTIFVREDCLLGFDLQLQFDNGKLALGDGEATPIVQLRGTGSVLLELMERMVAIEITEARNVLVRHEVVIGWTARVLPRALSLAEAPSGQRGLLSFAGDGNVLTTAR